MGHLVQPSIFSAISTLCLLLHCINTCTGFRSRQTPSPTSPGSTQEQAGSFSPPLSFPTQQILVTWRADVCVYHDLHDGSELTTHLPTLRLGAASETALLSPAPASANTGVKRADETRIATEAGAHNSRDRNPSPEGQTGKITTH